MELRPYQLDVINQTRLEFRMGKQRPLVVLPCGAGKTVCFAYMAHEHIKQSNRNVWFLVHRKELIDQTVDTFKRFGLTDEHVFVGMVQTLASKIRRNIPVSKPTLIIFDEAHHATAKTWRTIVDYFKDVPMIGLTATPMRANGENLGEIFDSMIVGVKAETLLEQGYLAFYDYYAPSLPVDLSSVRIKGSDYDQEQVAALFEKAQIYGDVKKYINLEHKTIIYSPSLAFSKQLAATIPGVVHFDGDTPDAERKQIVEDFRAGKIHCLTNVDLIGEGFDVPDCDTVILLRPTQSEALYIQQSMRGMRPSKDKKALIYDLVGNVYRHGLPTESREWSLTGKRLPRNRDGEPDIIVRMCKSCLRVYKGNKSICPYCNHDNGLTSRQIRINKEAELEKIEQLERKQARHEQGKARTYEQLIAIGKQRGYKNPSWWAKMILENRNKI